MWADYKSARAGNLKVAIGLVYCTLQMLILNAGRLQIRPSRYSMRADCKSARADGSNK
jgi:hypothetical protein